MSAATFTFGFIIGLNVAVIAAALIWASTPAAKRHMKHLELRWRREEAMRLALDHHYDGDGMSQDVYEATLDEHNARINELKEQLKS